MNRLFPLILLLFTLGMVTGCAEKIDWDDNSAYGGTEAKVAELEVRVEALEKQLLKLQTQPLAVTQTAASTATTPAASPAADNTAAANNTAAAVPEEEQQEPPLYLGNLLKPFTAPELADLEKKVADQGGWKDRPVIDSNVLLRQYLNGKPAPATVEQALKTENNSAEENNIIVHTLGRLPEDEAREVDFNATQIRHSPADIKSTNPILSSSSAEFEVLSLTNISFFSFTYDTFEFYAPKEYVVSWQTSPDMLYDKLVIRDDLTWSDGKPITAYDIEFTFKLIMTAQVPIPAIRSGTDEMLCVKAYDEHTVVYFHPESMATNTLNVNFPILPKHVYEESLLKDPSLTDSEYHVALENTPVVGGSYRIVKRIKEQTIELVAREDYYMHNGKQVRDKPYFKNIIYKIITAPEVSLMAMKRGDLDYSQLTIEQWQSQTSGPDFYNKCTRAQANEWTSFHFGWNMDTPFFADRKVRYAMSYAFDYDEMYNTILFNLSSPSMGIFHPLNPAYPKNPLPAFKQDLDKAEQLLDEAGWIDHDGDGIRDKVVDGKSVKFDFTLLTSTSNQIGLKCCELLRQDLDQIGVCCNVRPIEFTVLMQRTQDHEFHAYFGGWGAGVDPDTSKNIWKTGENRNYVGFSDPEVDDLFFRGQREFDRQKRLEIYGRIHNIIYEQQPYTFLFCRNAFYGVNKRMRGFGFYPRGIIPGGMWLPIAPAQE